MSADDKLRELGLTLPDVPTPVATYVSFKRVGDMVYLSGQGPKRADGTYPTGKVGRDVTVEEAQALLDKWCATRADTRMRATANGKSTVATLRR